MSIVLAVLVVLAVLLLVARAAEEEDDTEPEEPPVRAVERHLGSLNYGTPDAVENARRQLLSLGPGVVGDVVRQLERVEAAPHLLTPATQLRLEDVVVDFGLGGLLELRRHLVRIDEDHAAYPSCLRMFQRIGPDALEQLVREGDAVRGRTFDVTVWRMPRSARRDLADDVARYAPRLRERGARALAVASLREVDGERLPAILGAAAPALWLGGSSGAAARVRYLAEPPDPRWVIVRQALTGAPAIGPLPPPLDAAHACIAGVASAAERERLYGMIDGPDPSRDPALLALACASPDEAANPFARRLRAADGFDASDPILPAVCSLLGSQGARLALQALRSGTEPAAWIALHALRDVDLRAETAALLAAHTRRLGTSLAPAIIERIAVDEAAFFQPVCACLSSGDHDAVRGALAVAGTLQWAEAVPAMLDTMRADATVAPHATRAVELVGASAVGAVHRWSRMHGAAGAGDDASRVRELVTLLAERLV